MRPKNPPASPVQPTLSDRYGAEKFSRPGVQTVDLPEFVQMDIPPRELIMRPWLPEKSLVMVYGPRGIGKTYFALEVGLAVATAGTYLQWTTPSPRRVLYIDGEMPAGVLQERVLAMLKEADGNGDPHFELLSFDLQCRDRMPLNLADPDHQLELEPVLQRHDLIIVDNISTLVHGGRENEAESWLGTQGWALRQRAAGRSVMFIHHAGKAGNQRGTSRREDVLDTVIALRRPTDYDPNQGAVFEVHFEKSRGFFGDDAKATEATLTEDDNGRRLWKTRDVEAADLDRIVALFNEGWRQKDIASEIKCSKSKVSKALKKARALGLVVIDGGKK